MNLCLVAEGSCDAYFEYGIHIWDYGKLRGETLFFVDERLVFCTAAGDLIAREAGAYTCDPSGGPVNLRHRCILAAATKQLAEQISPLLTHVDFPDD